MNRGFKFVLLLVLAFVFSFLAAGALGSPEMAAANTLAAFDIMGSLQQITQHVMLLGINSDGWTFAAIAVCVLAVAALASLVEVGISTLRSGRRINPPPHPLPQPGGVGEPGTYSAIIALTRCESAEQAEVIGREVAAQLCDEQENNVAEFVRVAYVGPVEEANFLDDDGRREFGVPAFDPPQGETWVSALENKQEEDDIPS